MKLGRSPGFPGPRSDQGVFRQRAPLDQPKYLDISDLVSNDLLEQQLMVVLGGPIAVHGVEI